MDLYRRNRYLWVLHFKQLRIIIREKHLQGIDARQVLKQSQAQAARLRSAAYAAG